MSVGSVVVGEETHNDLSFSSPAPLYDGFLIIVNIPEEARAPMPQDFLCTTVYPLSQEDFQYRINGQRVTITVALDETYPADRIAIGEEIKLTFYQVRNPPSTKPTENYRIQIRTE